MVDSQPVLYYDLGSPYAYLAVERAERVLGTQPRLEPILLGAIFVLRGSGSWSQTPERAARVADLEARAARYGLPPFVWPAGWPVNGLRAMRAATWATELGAGPAFARAVFRTEFTSGADISDVDVLARCAAATALDPDLMRAAIESPAVKDALRIATDAAWDAGVRGVPTLIVAGRRFYGDDQLEAAAAA
jgi:2-hydroxychromene-2-carboxylate isomerase